MQSLTIGNMGGARTSCFHTNYPQEKPHVDLKCPNGLRFSSSNVQLGVMTSEIMDKTICKREALLEDV